MSQKLGRNAPCLCGSGLKYKKCCLPKHEEAAQARPAPRKVQTDHGSPLTQVEALVAGVTGQLPGI